MFARLSAYCGIVICRVLEACVCDLLHAVGVLCTSRSRWKCLELLSFLPFRINPDRVYLEQSCHLDPGTGSISARSATGNGACKAARKLSPAPIATLSLISGELY
jgi:hypothetical protein